MRTIEEARTIEETYLPDLATIAGDMKKLPGSDQAVVKYELYSDSLVWSDEFPKATELNTDCLRFLFRYRTSLILGEPDTVYEAFWREAKRQFPDWIGFRSDRTCPNRQLAEFYANQKKQALAAI